MLDLKRFLNQCSIKELRTIACRCNLPDQGNKNDLVSRIVRGSGYSLVAILERMSLIRLKNICRANGFPIYGNKEEIIDRIWRSGIYDESNRSKSIKEKCEICGHMYDIKMMEHHHFVPKSQTDCWGGVLLICANDHNLFHRLIEQEEKYQQRHLGFDGLSKLLKKVKREVRAGKYCRK